MLNFEKIYEHMNIIKIDVWISYRLSKYFKYFPLKMSFSFLFKKIHTVTSFDNLKFDVPCLHKV